MVTRVKHTVLITDGEQRAALAIVRSLGSAGYRCLVGSTSGRSLAGASRHAQKEIVLPDPGRAPGAYAATVEAVVRTEGVDLLIPVSEAAIHAVLRARDAIPARIPFPELAAFEAICDKARVLEAATAVGISVPRQVEVASADDGVAARLSFPIVLKPARSVYTAPDGTRGKAEVSRAADPTELRAMLRAYPRAAYPILAQEVVTGPGIGIFVLLHEGRLIARFAHRRVREKPPSGGVSVLRQSEPMDDDLLRRSLDLLRAFDWSGVAMVEFKRDEASGEVFLMEINGRFWGSLQLAVDAGVDFPKLLADVNLGYPTSPVDEYRFVRSRWLWGDVDHLLARWRDAGTSWRDRFAAFGGWVRAFGPGHTEEILRWTDPHPLARETALWLRHIVRR